VAALCGVGQQLIAQNGRDGYIATIALKNVLCLRRLMVVL
jgi:hypothetical protein